MNINDNFELKDGPTGLLLKVVVGKTMDRLHIERFQPEGVRNRDFFFNKDGSFDGTGSSMEGAPVEEKSMEVVLGAEGLKHSQQDVLM